MYGTLCIVPHVGHFGCGLMDAKKKPKKFLGAEHAPGQEPW